MSTDYKQKNIELCREYQNHLSDGTELIEFNDGLIHHIVNKYIKERGKLCAAYGYEDAIQDARIGLLDAAKNYDPKLGSFSTYAAHYIFGYSTTGYNKYKHMLHTPLYLQREENTIYFEDTAYTDDEKDQLFNRFLIDESTDVENTAMINLMSDTVRDLVLNLSTKISKRYIVALILYFGLDGGEELSTIKIAKLWGITHDRVSQIIHKALRYLRTYNRKFDIRDYESVYNGSSYLLNSKLSFDTGLSELKRHVSLEDRIELINDFLEKMLHNNEEEKRS